jgi:hypothetical protein
MSFSNIAEHQYEGNSYINYNVEANHSRNMRYYDNLTFKTKVFIRQVQLCLTFVKTMSFVL